MEEKGYNPYRPTSPISGAAIGIDVCFAIERDFKATDGYKDSEENLQFRLHVLKFLQTHTKESGIIDALISYLALNYVDRFLSNNGLPGIYLNDVSKDLDLLAACCLIAAARSRDEHFNRLSILMELQQAGVHFEDEKITDMDNRIVGALASGMKPITAFCFLEHFSSRLPFCNYNPGNIQTLIIQSHADIYLAELKPSVIAASALLVGAREHLDASEHDMIKNTFIHDFEMKEEELDLCSAKMKEHCDKRQIPIAVVRRDRTRAPGSAHLRMKGKLEVGEATSSKEEDTITSAEGEKDTVTFPEEDTISFAEAAGEGMHEMGFEINWVDDTKEQVWLHVILRKCCSCLVPGYLLD